MPKYFRYSNVLIYFSISFLISCYQSRCASLIGACEYLLRKILINQIDSLAQKRIHIKSKHALCTVRINVQIQLQTQKNICCDLRCCPSYSCKTKHNTKPCRNQRDRTGQDACRVQLFHWSRRLPAIFSPKSVKKCVKLMSVGDSLIISSRCLRSGCLPASDVTSSLAHAHTIN